jgi:dTDP-4-amino-4,6-dideoxygalactose transaminase
MHTGRSLANMQAIVAVAKAARIPVLEDSAVAFGAAIEGRAADCWGEAGVYSFFPSKPLPGIADAGMLATDDERIARRCRRLRNHGQDDGERFVHKEVGWKNRMDEIAAGVILHQLRCFDTMLTRRAAIAAFSDSAPVGVRRCVKPLISLAGQCLHSLRRTGVCGREDGDFHSSSGAGF